MEKIKDEIISILLRPNRSAIKPAGMLNRTPVKADTAAIIPTSAGSAPRWAAKSGSTGLFEIVELKIAKKPVIQRKRNELIVSNFPNMKYAGMASTESAPEVIPRVLMRLWQ